MSTTLWGGARANGVVVGNVVLGFDDWRVDGFSVSIEVSVGKELGDQLGPCVLECCEGISLDP